MANTNDYKTCAEYFGNGICALNFLWCPRWAEENGIFVPKTCKDKLSNECIYTTKEDKDDIP